MNTGKDFMKEMNQILYQTTATIFQCSFHKNISSWSEFFLLSSSRGSCWQYRCWQSTVYSLVCLTPSNRASVVSEHIHLFGFGESDFYTVCPSSCCLIRLPVPLRSAVLTTLQFASSVVSLISFQFNFWCRS